VGIFRSAAVIVQHASNPNKFDAIYVDGPGTLTVVPDQGVSVSFIFPAVASGGAYPVVLHIRTRLVTAIPTATTVGLRF